MKKTPIVIIVDDDNELHLLYKSAYRKALNDGVFIMKNFIGGEECLEFLKSEEAQKNWDSLFLFTDLMMPVMDGFQLLEIVNAQFPKIPMWIVSAFEEPDNIQRSKTLGVKGFMGKPLSPKSLLKLLESYSSNLT